MCFLLYKACCKRLEIEPTDLHYRQHAISNKATPVSKMPFGKHKGKPIKDVPISYVKWMIGNIHNIQPSLHSALIKRINADTLAKEKVSAK